MIRCLAGRKGCSGVQRTRRALLRCRFDTMYYICSSSHDTRTKNMLPYEHYQIYQKKRGRKKKYAFHSEKSYRNAPIDALEETPDLRR